ncbi:MAG: peptidylprolyl isomerase [Flavobacteriales bacterium]|nr:peptidylprolyl isomerase [Flavobacteriales bacterium]
MRIVCSTLFCLGLLLIQQTAWSQDKGQLIEDVVATVGNEILLHSENKTQEQQYSEQGLVINDQIRTQIIEDLLFQKLLLHQARVDSLEVSEAEILSETDRRLEYFISVFGSIEEFEQYFGQSVAEWKAELHDPIEEQLLIQQKQADLNSRTSATPSQVQAYYDGLPQDSIPLINAEIEYSKVEMAPQVTEEEKQKAFNLLDSVRTEVVNGASMSLAAIKYSEDPGSKYKGGCYEGVRRGQFVPEFEAAVYAAGVDGYSPVFESDFGYHFVYVENILGEVYNPCHILVKPKVKEEDVDKAKDRLDSVLVDLRSGQISFQRAAILYSTDEESANQEGRVTNPRTGGYKHDVSVIDPTIFFNLDKLEEGEISDPSLVIDDVSGTQSWVIYKLMRRIDAHKANLRQDYLLFQRQTEATLRDEALKKWISDKINMTFISLEGDLQLLNFQNNWVKSNG